MHIVENVYLMYFTTVRQRAAHLLINYNSTRITIHIQIIQQ